MGTHWEGSVMEEERVQLKAPYLKCSNITEVEDAQKRLAGLIELNSTFINNNYFEKGGIKND